MIRLEPWRRGMVLIPDSDEDRRMYFWFYEWTLFEAVFRGQHVGCPEFPDHTLAADGRSGHLDRANMGLRLTVNAVEDGAQLVLDATNRSDHHWPEVASIVPCFNPGLATEVPESPSFFDEAHQRTWYVGLDGPAHLVRRDIHFNHECRQAVDAQAEDDGTYVFSDKWPTSPDDAAAGLIVRESADRQWVTGIAWERFLSAQGHNPWRCMHLSVRLGPLAPGASRQVRGRAFLFPGTKGECLAKFRQWLNGD